MFRAGYVRQSVVAQDAREAPGLVDDLPGSVVHGLARMSRGMERLWNVICLCSTIRPAQPAGPPLAKGTLAAMQGSLIKVPPMTEGQPVEF